MKRLIIILVLILSSCQLQKKALTTDNSKLTTVTERKEITRKGDSVKLYIPNIHFKDTTITRENYVTKTKVRVVYDDYGNQEVICTSAEINEKLEKINQQLVNDKKTKTETQSEFTPQHFIYALAVLVLLVLIVLIALFFIYLKL